jgi:AbrB family looped-hinge helix DNA binding protein
MNYMKTLRVSPKGQISIPKEARETLGIKTGEDLVMFVSKKGILLEKTKELVNSIEDRVEAWECMLASEEVLKGDWDNEYDERWNKY